MIMNRNHIFLAGQFSNSCSYGWWKADHVCQ